MKKEYYKEYQTIEREHWWFIIREQIIKTQLKTLIDNQTGLTILNIGCATGKSSEMLSEFGPVISVEYDVECCAFLRNELGMEVVNASITDLPFESNSFDLVCAFDVIEHVQDHTVGVNEISRVCKNNGIVAITVPAFNFLWSYHDVVNHHYRRYNKSELSELFNKTLGFKKLRLTYFNFFLFLPILIFRTISNLLPNTWLKSSNGSDFTIKGQSKLINKSLKMIFGLEISLLKVLNFPFGVSIIGIWKKN